VNAAPPRGTPPTHRGAALHGGLEPGDCFCEVAMFQIVEARLRVAWRREAA